MQKKFMVLKFVLFLSAVGCASNSRTPASNACLDVAPDQAAACRANAACPMGESSLLQDGRGFMKVGSHSQALNAQRLCVQQNLESEAAGR